MVRNVLLSLLKPGYSAQWSVYLIALWHVLFCDCCWDIFNCVLLFRNFLLKSKNKPKSKNKNQTLVSSLNWQDIPKKSCSLKKKKKNQSFTHWKSFRSPSLLVASSSTFSIWFFKYPLSYLIYLELPFQLFASSSIVFISSSALNPKNQTYSSVLYQFPHQRSKQQGLH